MAEAGWYPLPSDPTKLMYYDGSQWVGTPVAVPQQAPQPAPPEERARGGSAVDEFFDNARSFVKDEKNQGTAMAVAGGAAIADGVVGIGRRPGIGSAISSIFFGVIFVVVGLSFGNIFSSAMTVPEQRPNEQVMQAQVVEMTYDSDGYCIPHVSVEDQTVRLPLPVKTSPCRFSVGDSVAVYHVPGTPESTRISAEAAEDMQTSMGGFMNLFTWVFAGIGAFVAIGGIFQLLMKLGVIAGGSVLMVMGLRKRKAAQEARDTADSAE